jgi:hypothetical protein
MHEKIGWKPLSGFQPLIMQKCDTRQDRWLITSLSQLSLVWKVRSLPIGIWNYVKSNSWKYCESIHCFELKGQKTSCSRHLTIDNHGKLWQL